MNQLLATRPDTRPVAASRSRVRRHHYGPWAVVTGASDGIGRAFATVVAEAGLDVVLVARRAELLEELARHLTSTFGVDARVIPADLGTREGIESLVEGTNDLDVGLLVAAAGFGTSGSFVDAAIEDELAMVDVNCRAVAAVSHHFGGRFARQKRGGIVLLSSIVAFQGVPRAANYAATKAYVHSLAEGLGVELAPFGVDVLAVAPGPVRSGFADRARMVMGATVEPEVVARESLASLHSVRMARPGLLSKVLGWSLAFLPRWMRVHMMAIVMGKMTSGGR
jgi:short-subunit dehydrogenase